MPAGVLPEQVDMPLNSTGPVTIGYYLARFVDTAGMTVVLLSGQRAVQ